MRSFSLICFSVMSFPVIRAALKKSEKVQTLDRATPGNPGEMSYIVKTSSPSRPHRLVFGLLLDLREPYGKKEWMTEKMQEVIRKHMDTVRQIACLLGENAAYTDATLRSILESIEDKY